MPRPAYHVTFVDKAQRLTWTDSREGGPVELDVVSEYGGRPKLAIAVLVDTVPAEPPYDTFAAELETRKESLSGSLRILHRQDEIPPKAGSATAAEVATVIRRFAGQRETNEIHLFLRTPWPLAALLGRELNTYRVALYEWDDLGDGRCRYSPTVTVASGVGGGPIIDVTAST